MDFTDRLEALLRESRATGSIDEYLKWLELVKLLVDHAPALLDVVKAAQQCVDPNDTWPQEGRQIKLRQALTRLSDAPRKGEG
jgi:hypothetical protein